MEMHLVEFGVPDDAFVSWWKLFTSNVRKVTTDNRWRVWDYRYTVSCLLWLVCLYEIKDSEKGCGVIRLRSRIFEVQWDYFDAAEDKRCLYMTTDYMAFYWTHTLSLSVCLPRTHSHKHFFNCFQPTNILVNTYHYYLFLFICGVVDINVHVAVVWHDWQAQLQLN